MWKSQKPAIVLKLLIKVLCIRIAQSVFERNLNLLINDYEMFLNLEYEVINLGFEKRAHIVKHQQII